MSSLRFHCCALAASECEKLLVGSLRNDLGRRGSRLLSLLLRTALHFAISEPDCPTGFLARSCFANWRAHSFEMAREMCRLELCRAAISQSSAESCGIEVFVAACDSCCFATRKIFWDIK